MPEQLGFERPTRPPGRGATLLQGESIRTRRLASPRRVGRLCARRTRKPALSRRCGSFAQYGDYVTEAGGTTARQELVRALGRLGEAARPSVPTLESLRDDAPSLRSDIDAALETIGPAEPVSCCCGNRPAVRAEKSAARGNGQRELARLELQDQDGRSFLFRDVFHGQPTIVVFFYTRCDNPRKCPLTMAKLARVQQLIGREEIATAGFTYDPAYDLPGRLRAYGESYGVTMNDRHRLLRTTGPFEALQSYFELGVSKAGSLVTHHRLEAFVLDAAGVVAASVTRAQWNEEDLVAAARRLV